MKNIFTHRQYTLLSTLLLMSFIALFSMTTAFAEASRSPAETRSQNDKTLDNAVNAAMKIAVKGPAIITLLDQAALNLPKGYLFIPQKEAADLLKATGNKTSSEFFGIVMPEGRFQWIITIDYIKSGYINDSDAKKWNAEDLLNSLKKGTAAANKERAAEGFPTIDITGWIEPPKYDATSHKLIWSIQGKDSESQDFVNYNTYALGREGYFELNLLTSYKSIAESKLDANKVLSSLNYDEGKRYADFIQGKDHIAEYGLAALITGIAAKKLGLLALAGVFIVKVWKILAVACFVFFGKIKKLFKRDK
jgi:uncharacterized membrane-anchored protein